MDVTAKLAASGPLNEGALKSKQPTPAALLIVTVCTLDEVFANREPKLNVGGAAVNPGVPAPAVDAVALNAPTDTEMVPLAGPTAVGA